MLAERARQPAGTLSGGEQQMLAIARCLMGAPQLIMFDEPSLGLAPKVAHDVLDTIRELNREGLTCLLVEQNVAQSLKLADRAYVLENGRVTLMPAAAPSFWPTTACAAPIWDCSYFSRAQAELTALPSSQNERRRRSMMYAERRHPRAQRRQRKGLPQPTVDLGRGRRFDIGKGRGHRAGHVGFGPSAQHCRHHRDIAERGGGMNAQGDTAGPMAELHSDCGSLPTREVSSEFHKTRQRTAA